jgi:hypothetical protein
MEMAISNFELLDYLKGKNVPVIVRFLLALGGETFILVPLQIEEGDCNI